MYRTDPNDIKIFEHSFLSVSRLRSFPVNGDAPQLDPRSSFITKKERLSFSRIPQNYDIPLMNVSVLLAIWQ